MIRKSSLEDEEKQNMINEIAEVKKTDATDSKIGDEEEDQLTELVDNFKESSLGGPKRTSVRSVKNKTENSENTFWSGHMVYYTNSSPKVWKY